MSPLVWGMSCAGVAALAIGLSLAWPRFRAASGAGKLIAVGPVFEAAPLAVFAMEHFLDANDLMKIVPRWLPGPLFWTYFFGVCLMAAAVSFILRLGVRWAASLLALFFLIIVVTLDLPNMAKDAHDRFFWILTVRETAFGAGALVLAGSIWPSRAAGAALLRIGRTVLAPIFVFYAIEHFFFPHNVPGVPLEKITPDWMPASVLIDYITGIILLVAGPALLFQRTVRVAAAGSGLVLLLLSFLFYGPILATEFRTPAAVEGLNYIYDTMLFAGTALLAGLDGRTQKTGDRDVGSLNADRNPPPKLAIVP
jgi:uncharacterized membrane protein